MESRFRKKKKTKQTHAQIEAYVLKMPDDNRTVRRFIRKLNQGTIETDIYPSDIDTNIACNNIRAPVCQRYECEFIFDTAAGRHFDEVVDGETSTSSARRIHEIMSNTPLILLTFRCKRIVRKY